MFPLSNSDAMWSMNLRNSKSASFKKPLTGNVRKIKPKILTEVKYIEELSKIVQRDFFPDLVKLRAQNDYLEAESQKDYLTMAAIRAEYTKHIPKTSPTIKNKSPTTFETPVSTVNATPHPDDASLDTASTTFKPSNENKAECESNRISTKLSLDAFLQHYTSEDNHSFQEIIETTEANLRQKFAALYKQEELSAEQLKLALTLPSIEKQFDIPDPMRKIETWNYTNRNSVMYVPDAVSLNVEDRARTAECNQRIQHSATRLPITLTQRSTLVKETTENTFFNLSIKQGEGSGHKIKGYKLIASPKPCFETFSPIMTWGEIEGTPIQLDCSDTPLHICEGPSFRICENSRRENIAIALADKVGVKMRAQKQQALYAAVKNIGSPFMRSKLERLASMSPAAQHLATAKLGLRNSTPLTSMLTPSPSLTSVLMRKTRAANKNSEIIVDTDKLGLDNTGNNSNSTVSSKIRIQKMSNNINTVNKRNIDTGSTLTDDLLQIPIKRRKAIDFF